MEWLKNIVEFFRIGQSKLTLPDADKKEITVDNSDPSMYERRTKNPSTTQLGDDIAAVGFNDAAHDYYDPRLARQSSVDTYADSSAISLPVQGGRQSVNMTNAVNGAFSDFSTIPTDFDPQWFDILDYLCTFNGDFKKAVSNTVDLASTEIEWKFSSRVGDALKNKALEIIAERLEEYNPEGSQNITNMLLRQLIIKGAISAEIVPSDSLDGVKEIVPVPHKYIRFKWNRDTKEFYPVQKLAVMATTGNAYGEIILNTVTYKYYGDIKKDGSPYALPPFLAALESTGLNRDIWGSFAAAFTRLGLFGFLNVLIKAPTMLPNESDTTYIKRMAQYLDAAVDEVSKGIDRGFVAGFQGYHEFKMEGTMANLRDGAEYLKASTEDKITGLGQSPFMMGKSYSTTETFARVLLLMLGKQVETFQMQVAKFWGDVVTLDLRMKGIMVGKVTAEFKFPMLGDEKGEAETEGLKIANVEKKISMGIITQDEGAQELGYEKAALPAPRPNPNPLPAPNVPQQKDKTIPSKKTQPNSIKYAGQLTLPDLEYNYGIDHNCGCDGLVSYGESFDALIQSYLNGTFAKYEKATARMSVKISKALAKLVNPSLQEVQDTILSELYLHFDSLFTTGRKRLIDKYISQLFRLSKSQALLAFPKDFKSPVFNLLDFRAMEFFAKNDDFYLGKFITDQSTKNKLNAWIEEKYLKDDLPFRDKRHFADAFKKEFSGQLNLEEWKIFRIISTTVNRIRNAASLSYMNDALITQYQIMGVNDRLQCAYCSTLQGKVFNVSNGMSKLNELVTSDPTMTPFITPFITSLFKNADEMKDLTSAQLEAMGICFPPFHSHCRDRIVAIQ